jgi:hypothetical protein
VLLSAARAQQSSAVLGFCFCWLFEVQGKSIRQQQQMWKGGLQQQSLHGALHSRRAPGSTCKQDSGRRAPAALTLDWQRAPEGIIVIII